MKTDHSRTGGTFPTVADELESHRDNVNEILALGLRKWQAEGRNEFHDFEDVITTLANLPTPEEVLAIRPSPELQSRIDELLEKSKTVGFSPADEADWQQIEFMEHVVRMAKAQAAVRLNSTAS